MNTIENLTPKRRKIMRLSAKANRLIFRGKNEAAVRKLQKAESFLDSTDHDLACEMAVIYTVPLQRFDDGLRLLKPAAEAGQPEAFVRLGSAYIFNQQPQEAIAPLMRAVKLGGDDAVLARQFLGRAHYLLDNLNEAGDWYRQAAEDGEFLFRYLALNCYLAADDKTADIEVPSAAQKRLEKVGEACLKAAITFEDVEPGLQLLKLRTALDQWERAYESNLRKRVPLASVHSVLLAYFIYGTNQVEAEEVQKVQKALSATVELSRYLMKYLPENQDSRNLLIGLCMEAFLNANTYYAVNEQWTEWDETLTDLDNAADRAKGDNEVVERLLGAAAVNQAMGVFGMHTLGLESPHALDDLWEKLTPVFARHIAAIDLVDTKHDQSLSVRRACCLNSQILLGTLQPEVSSDLLDTITDSIEKLTAQERYTPPEVQLEIDRAMVEGVAFVEQHRPGTGEGVRRRGGEWPRTDEF